MDRFSRLQALTGDEEVYDGVYEEEEKEEEESKFEPFMFPTPQPRHLYEGTDSEDDEIITSRRSENNFAYVKQKFYQAGMLSMLTSLSMALFRIYVVHFVNIAGQYCEFSLHRKLFLSQAFV
jgi:hypothetical protein